MQTIALREDILFGVPQRPISGPLFFNIFMCDLFIILEQINFTSHANENTPSWKCSHLSRILFY